MGFQVRLLCCTWNTNRPKICFYVTSCLFVSTYQALPAAPNLGKKRRRFSPEADEISPLIWVSKFSQGYSVYCIAPASAAIAAISKSILSPNKTRMDPLPHLGLSVFARTHLADSQPDPQPPREI
jgi:hypothetical protein